MRRFQVWPPTENDGPKSPPPWTVKTKLVGSPAVDWLVLRMMSGNLDGGKLFAEAS